MKKFFVTSVLLVSAFVISITPAIEALADRFDAQIRKLQSEIDGYQSEARELRSKSNTLKGEIARIDAQNAAVERQIKLGEIKLAQIKEQIADTEKKLIQQKDFLASIVRTLYIEGEVTPIERLASSKSVSDYLDKQEYSNRISNQLQSIMDKLEQLQKELEEQKKKSEREIKDQKARRQELAAVKKERATLLAQTQGQEAAYQRLSKQKRSEIASLRAQQAAANAGLGGVPSYGTCGGGYPNSTRGAWGDNWGCNHPLDNTVDNWGMFNRECVSYTAFRVAASGRHMPAWGMSSIGNANQWDDNARRIGIPVDGNPRVGDVAIFNSQPYGHAMYVEHVYGNGTILISEYNGDWTGRYSTRTISQYGLVFIHF